MKTDVATEWDRKVAAVLARVDREANRYLALGMIVYGGGAGLILWLVRDRMLAGYLVMFLFQLCLIYFGPKAVYRCVASAFHVGLLANRETVPVFEQMKGSIERAEARMEKASLDIRASGDRIHGEVKRLADAMERPIAPPVRPLVGPHIPAESSDGGNGQAPG